MRQSWRGSVEEVTVARVLSAVAAVLFARWWLDEATDLWTAFYLSAPFMLIGYFIHLAVRRFYEARKKTWYTG